MSTPRRRNEGPSPLPCSPTRAHPPAPRSPDCSRASWPSSGADLGKSVESERVVHVRPPRRGLHKTRGAQAVEVMDDGARAEREAPGKLFDRNGLALREHANDAQSRCVGEGLERDEKIRIHDVNVPFEFDVCRTDTTRLKSSLARTMNTWQARLPTQSVLVKSVRISRSRRVCSRLPTERTRSARPRSRSGPTIPRPGAAATSNPRRSPNSATASALAAFVQFPFTRRTSSICVARTRISGTSPWTPRPTSCAWRDFMARISW